jgi:plastocyanin
VTHHWRTSVTRRAALLMLGVLLLATGCGGDSVTGAGPKPATVAIIEVRGPLFVGQSWQLEARALDGAGAEIAAGDPSWTSSNAQVATVTESGLLTAVAAGKSTVRATINGRSASTELTFEDLPPATVTVTMTGANFAPADVTIRLNGSVAFVFPATAHDVVFGTSPAGAPTDIPSTVNTTVRKVFAQTGDFTYRSTVQSAKSGVVHVR